MTYINKKKFKCKVCDAELADEWRLKNHMKVHRRKKFKNYEYGTCTSTIWEAGNSGRL